MHLNFEKMTDSALLNLALDSVEVNAPRSLLELFGLVFPVCENAFVCEERAKYTVNPKIAAFKELYTRAMNEKMSARDCLSDPLLIQSYLRGRISNKGHEVFGALFLDARNSLIKDEILFTGTLTQTSVYPREIVKKSLAYNCASIVFYHNHPSGDSNPSRADECLTQELKKTLSLIDVRVLDHFIITAFGSVSMATRGLM